MYMNLKTFFKFVLFLSIIFPSLLKGQSNPYGDVSIASPTAASLGKYADIPVSYHTGIPQINIPLYTVKAGPISLPISLSYHASGLKVIENASWVGAGWSLDAGGVITRTVVGQPDEKGANFGGTETNGYFSDTGYNKYLYSGVDQDWLGFSAGRKDGEPDLFFFNFGGYTGKFFFRDDLTPILVPQQDLRIIPYYPNTGQSGQSIQGFTIITPDGAQYFFGNTAGFTGIPPTEMTSTFAIIGTAGAASGGTAISSWFLNKIISADGLFVINLVYTTESYGYYTLSTSPLDPYSLPASPSINLVKNMMSGVRLSQITFPNGSVSFNPGQVRTDLSDNFANDNDNLNSSATTLGSISISNTSLSNSFCKKFVFNYSYFVDNTTPQPTVVTASGYVMQTDKSRLRLDSLKEMTCDNLLQIPARKFKYFSELLPRRLNLGIDHWGFNNGVTSNQNLIPTYTTNDGVTVTTIPGANRDASWPAMRGGSLQQITYPTGGTTTFDFEPADSYTLSASSQQNLLISGSASSVHLFGQSSHADTIPFVSNGNTMTLTAFNNTNYLASISIKNIGTGVVVYSTGSIPDNNYPAGQTTTYTIPAVAGNYQYILSIPTVGPGSGEGASVTIFQIQTVITNTPVTIGGLRIKTITQKDSINNGIPIVTSYTYPSGGFLYSFPTYVQHIRNDLITNLGYWDASSGFTKGLGSNNGCPLSGSYFVRSGGSLRPMATTQGYHIGYPTVKVSQTSNGYSIYTYYTSNTGYGAQSLNPSIQTVNIQLSACESNTPNYPPAPLSFDYRKGELYSEQHYNPAGQPLKDEYYYPQFDSSSLQPAPGFIVASRSNPSGVGQILFGTLYNLSSPRRTSMHTVETNYTPGMGGTQVDTYTYYGSLYHNQETRKVVTTSTGDSLITNTKYTPDFHLSSWDISPSCEMTYTNNCSTCLTTYNNGQAGCGTNNTCLTTLFLTYRQCLSNARNTYVNSRITNYVKAGNNYSTQHNISKTNAGAELKPILDLQDENRVVPIEVTDYRDGSLLKANFTRYDYVTSPTGFPYPNKTQLVSLLAPSSTFSNAAISGNTLSKDSRYLDESTYGYLSGNPAKVTAHDGMNTYYVWDYLNTNPIAKTVSGTIDSTAYTSFEADGKGNWTFPVGGDSSSQVTVNVNAANTTNIFTSQTPVANTSNDYPVNTPIQGIESGLKFTSTTAGYITGVRFYKTAGNAGTHTGELYSSSGTRLAQATFTNETTTGWQTVTFATPVTITANTTYTIAYFSSLGYYVEDNNYFLGHSVTNGPLTAPADGTSGASGTDPGNGQGTFVYTTTPGFPNQLFKSANYWVDPIFSSGSTPVANAGINQTITLPMSSVTLNGGNSMGIITSYAWTKISGPNNPTITSPTSVMTTATGLIAGTYVFQISINAGASTSQVAITVNAAGTPVNIFTTQTPVAGTDNDYPANTSIQGIEDGVKFTSSVAGTITGIRFYKTAGNTGTHIGELYSSSGTRLAQATFTNETTTGWQTVTFTSPVTITANTTYIASYFSSLGYYVEDNYYFQGNSVVNGPLTAPLDGTGGGTGADPGNGQSLYKYTASAAFPDQIFRSANYWVDVLFVTGSTPAPSAGSNQTVALPATSITLDGSGSTGTITSYLWTEISGPNNAIIATPNNVTTPVTGLIQGTYVFKLSVNGGVSSSYALTGLKSYNLSGNTISKSGLISGNKYVVSYWTKGSVCSISGGTSTSTAGRVVNGWTYYEHKVTMTSSSLSIFGTNYIDELRLYPQGALMSSYTYKPLVGITTMNDPNSEITYYEYDGLERLKNIKDYQGNIIKNFQYNYVDPNACGPNCLIVTMQTFAGTSTISYPVGVFNINGKLLGNATTQAQYISTWMADTADSHTGTIAAGTDSMHFKFTVNSGRTIPNAVTGCRYYQFDLAYTIIDAIRNRNGTYIDFGDGTGMRLGITIGDSNVVRAPNTFINSYSYVNGTSNPNIYWNHTYPDSSLRTITFYHNDGTEDCTLDNGSSPALSFIHLKNFRGNLPQNTQSLVASDFQQASALTVASINNWNSINGITGWQIRTGDLTNPCLHLSYAQDFMANNRNLQFILTDDRGPYLEGYEDSTFKISRLKSNWNTYFTNLTTLEIIDDHWNREDLTALIHLSLVGVGAGNLHHSYNQTNNPLVPLPVSVVDNVINQIAAGAGQFVSNGLLVMPSGGTNRSSASDIGFNILKAKGWTIIINGSNL
jgi:YD repeat-containing protein